jgi:hypothetical protein
MIRGQDVPGRAALGIMAFVFAMTGARHHADVIVLVTG